MKFAPSIAALLLFVAIASCVPTRTGPTKTKRDDSTPTVSIISSSFPSTVVLPNSLTVSDLCDTVGFVKANGELVVTTTCLPDVDGDDDNGNSDGSQGGDGANNVAGDDQNNGNASNSTSHGSNSSNGSQGGSDSDDNQGVGASIVATGTISASQINPAGSQSSSGGSQSSSGGSQSTSGSGSQGSGASGSKGSDGSKGPKGSKGSQGSQGSQGSSQGDTSGFSKNTKRNVVTSNTVSTPDGPVTENCQIQLIPQPNGLYTEIQTCDVSIEPNNTASSSGVQNNSPSPDVSPEVIIPSSVMPDATPTMPASSASSSFSPLSSPVLSSPTSPTPLPSLTSSSDPASSSSGSDQSSSSSSSSSSSTSDGAIIIGTGVTSLQLPSSSPLVSALSSSSNGTTNGTSVADTASFSVPGKHLSVLPVGLAVFAGVSVIALIVVGVVTYERTKYRKNFRKRQMAEQLKARTDQMSERSMV